MLRARYKLYGRTQEAQLRFRAIRDLIRISFELERRSLQRICSYYGNLACIRKGRLGDVDRLRP
jgi:hypothetical protein